MPDESKQGEDRRNRKDRPSRWGWPQLERVGGWLSLLAAALVLVLGFDLDGSRRTALVAQLERSLSLELAEAQQEFERALESSVPMDLGPSYGLEIDDGFQPEPRSYAVTLPAFTAVELRFRQSGEAERALRELDLLETSAVSPTLAAQIEMLRLRIERSRWETLEPEQQAQANADLAAQADRAWSALEPLLSDAQLPVPDDGPVPFCLSSGLFLLDCFQVVAPERQADLCFALATAWLTELAQPSGKAQLVEPAPGEAWRLEFDALYEELGERLLGYTDQPGPGHLLQAHRQLLATRAIAPILARAEVASTSRTREWFWQQPDHLLLLTFERRNVTFVPTEGLAEALDLPQPWLSTGGRTVRLAPLGELFDRAPGSPLPAPVEILGGRFGLTLEHPEPAELVRAALGPWAVQRVAAVVLAFLLAFTGWASSRALRRARELADARSLLVAGVSHELRTPVASILVLADNLNHATARKSPRAERYPSLIRQEALRLKALVDDLLDFSRLERNKPIELALADVDVRQQVERWSMEFDELARGRGFDYEPQIDPGCSGGIRADAEALRRALLNLVKNALLHSGGQRLEFTARLLPEGLGLGVRDDGRGIDREEWQRLIQPFERGQARGATSGTGLGLAIAHGLAQAHRGHLHLRPHPAEQGAWFEIVLPLSVSEDLPITDQA